MLHTDMLQLFVACRHIATDVGTGELGEAQSVIVQIGQRRRVVWLSAAGRLYVVVLDFVIYPQRY